MTEKSKKRVHCGVLGPSMKSLKEEVLFPIFAIIAF